MGNLSRRGRRSIHSELASWHRISLDTSALIYFLQGSEPRAAVVREVMSSVRQGQRRLVLSVIGELELLVKPLQDEDLGSLEIIRLLCHGTEHVEMRAVDDQITHRAALLRARDRLRLADALIVATAIEAGCDGMIGNDRLCAQRVREIPYLYLDALAGASPA